MLAGQDRRGQFGLRLAQPLWRHPLAHDPFHLFLRRAHHCALACIERTWL